MIAFTCRPFEQISSRGIVVLAVKQCESRWKLRPTVPEYRTTCVGAGTSELFPDRAPDLIIHSYSLLRTATHCTTLLFSSYNQFCAFAFELLIVFVLLSNLCYLHELSISISTKLPTTIGSRTLPPPGFTGLPASEIAGV